MGGERIWEEGHDGKVQKRTDLTIYQLNSQYIQGVDTQNAMFYYQYNYSVNHALMKTALRRAMKP